MSRVLPILFNSDMVRAILDGRKTVTRRLMKPQLPSSCPACHYVHNEFIYDLGAQNVYCARCGEPLYNGGFPYNAPYHPGDILYVRETWQECCRDTVHSPTVHSKYCFKASADDCPFYGCIENCGQICNWRPSIHMPKEAARIWLKVTDVRVERLQDMRSEDALNEGIQIYEFDLPGKSVVSNFKKVWNSTIKKSVLHVYGWDANPWVWRIKFERCEKLTEVD